MSKGLTDYPFLHMLSGLTYKISGLFFLILFATSAIFNSAMANDLIKNQNTQQYDSKKLFDSAVSDYFSGKNSQAQEKYNRLKKSDYASVVSVPAAVNLVALGQYSQAQNAFNEVARGSNVRDKEYAQLWQLWLTAKTWKGNDENLDKELKRLFDSQAWHLPFEKSIAGLYAGRETVENVFNSISVFNGSTEQQQDAQAEAIFFTGGYLQNVKHDNASAMKLFNENINKLNTVSLERLFIDRERASLKKLTYKK